jgi:hypothetical protein
VTPAVHAPTAGDLSSARFLPSGIVILDSNYQLPLKDFRIGINVAESSFDATGA